VDGNGESNDMRNLIMRDHAMPCEATLAIDSPMEGG